MDGDARQPAARDLLGLEVGARGTPHAPVVKALTARGLSLPHDTITDLRSGRATGRYLANRFAAAERLTNNDASLKTGYFLRLLRTAWQLRAPSYEGARPYVTHGFGAAIG